MKSFLSVICLITSLIAVHPTSAYAADNSVWLEKDQPATIISQIFEVPVWLETSDSANAFEIVISCPPELKFVGSSTQGSVVSLWVELPHSIGSGTLRMIGGVPNPGFARGRVKLSQLNFISEVPGSHAIIIKSARVLANDGLGSELLVQVHDLNVLIGKLVDSTPRGAVAPVIVTTEIIPRRQTDSWTIPPDLA